MVLLSFSLYIVSSYADICERVFVVFLGVLNKQRDMEQKGRKGTGEREKNINNNSREVRMHQSVCICVWHKKFRFAHTPKTNNKMKARKISAKEFVEEEKRLHRGNKFFPFLLFRTTPFLRMGQRKRELFWIWKKNQLSASFSSYMPQSAVIQQNIK